MLGCRGLGCLASSGDEIASPGASAALPTETQLAQRVPEVVGEDTVNAQGRRSRVLTARTGQGLQPNKEAILHIGA